MHSIHRCQARVLELPGRTVYVLVGSERLPARRMTFGVTEVPPETAMPPHAHEGEEEIIFVLQGFGEALVGGSVENLEPNTAVVFPQGVTHAVTNKSREVMKFTFCFNSRHEFGGV